MRLKNPRRWSVRHAIVVGAVAAVSLFVALCFEFGGGSFGKGLSDAAGYLIFFWFGLGLMAGFAAGVAVILGRFLGTTLTMGIAVVLLAVMVVFSYVGSQPINRFRDLVWESAPGSITIKDYTQYQSFNDGTTRTFVLECDSSLRDSILQATGLGKSSERLNPQILEILFRGVAPPADAEVYAGGNLVLVYLPSQHEARIACLR
ncbi:MAG: hypothetical protein ABII82_01675 [Verrucomicrobiota bacterium]